MKTLKTIIEEYNHPVEFPILGTTLTISKERNIYNEMRKKYQSLIPDAVRIFEEHNKNFKDLNDLLDNAQSKLILSLNEILKEISTDAISMGITTISPATFADECFKGYFKSFAEKIKEFRTQVQMAEQEYNRESVSDNVYYHRVGDVSSTVHAGVASAIDSATAKAADTTTPQGALMLTIFAGLSQFEADLIAQRTREGLAAARSRGRFGGRPKTDDEKIRRALKMYDGGFSVGEVCKSCDISKSTLYNFLSERKVNSNAKLVQ